MDIKTITAFRADPERSAQRKEALKELYARWFAGDTCRHFAACSAKMRSECSCFWEKNDFSARVGDYYDLYYNEMPIRILMIGKEGLSVQSQVRPPARLMEKMNRHYSVTFRTLKKMLNYWPREKSHDAVLQTYALTNMYSCAFKTKQGQTTGIPNSDLQKVNCAALRREEIRILEPTIVVIQNGSLKADCLFDDTCNLLPRPHGAVAYSAAFGCHILETAHPSCRSYPWVRDLDDCIDFLRKTGALPPIEISTTEILDELTQSLPRHRSHY